MLNPRKYRYWRTTWDLTTFLLYVLNDTIVSEFKAVLLTA
jgi:hypothetical protein